MIFNKISDKIKILINILVIVLSAVIGITKAFMVILNNSYLWASGEPVIEAFAVLSTPISAILVFVSLWSIVEIIVKHKTKKVVVVSSIGIVLSLIAITLTLFNLTFQHRTSFKLNYSHSMVVWFILLLVLTLIYSIIYIQFRNEFNNNIELAKIKKHYLIIFIVILTIFVALMFSWILLDLYLSFKYGPSKIELIHRK
ncbi:hypothetical protein NXS15_03715 [Mycoplasma sp. CSL7475-4]|uniref:hypothetical protein n=1 Tax=Mycoplasma sp. CSL7475-4 TaxID=2973942 RepID=UPI00216B3A23|nr:hypothetical protein [Mycoplasma sp. CSL7475-4]MCS4537217.1 hypothetical protein [Mycoplasma sp. CSL7475-4]